LSLVSECRAECTRCCARVYWKQVVLFAETGCPWKARRLHGSESVCALLQLAYRVPTDCSRRSRSPSARESGQCRALRRTGHEAGAASRTSAILSSVRKSVFIWHRINHLANRTSPILRYNSARSLWIGIPKRWKVDPFFWGHVRPPTNLLGLRFWVVGQRWCRVKRL
jgi:hypothetical protein